MDGLDVFPSAEPALPAFIFAAAPDCEAVVDMFGDDRVVRSGSDPAGGKIRAESDVDELLGRERADVEDDGTEFMLGCNCIDEA
jgi:hypothetical protein